MTNLPMNERLLVVDDDDAFRDTLAHFLSSHGYKVDQAANIAEARKALASRLPDLVLLDLAMPGGDGLELARELHVQSAVPTVIVSGKTGTIDKIVGLEIGADDYITKPFELRELLARIRAVMRRTTRSDQQRVASTGERLARFGGFILNTSKRDLSAAGGTHIDLTGAEYNLLNLLVERANRVLSRDAIADLIRTDDWEGIDRSIDTMVSRLRKKLSPHVDPARLIQTVRGEGYVLAAEIEWSG